VLGDAGLGDGFRDVLVASVGVLILLMCCRRSRKMWPTWNFFSCLVCRFRSAFVHIFAGLFRTNIRNRVMGFLVPRLPTSPSASSSSSSRLLFSSLTDEQYPMNPSSDSLSLLLCSSSASLSSSALRARDEEGASLLVFRHRSIEVRRCSSSSRCWRERFDVCGDSGSSNVFWCWCRSSDGEVRLDEAHKDVCGGVGVPMVDCWMKDW
jgi:hypothetical protein